MRAAIVSVALAAYTQARPRQVDRPVYAADRQDPVSDYLFRSESSIARQAARGDEEALLDDLIDRLLGFEFLDASDEYEESDDESGDESDEPDDEIDDESEALSDDESEEEEPDSEIDDGPVDASESPDL